MVPLAHHSTQPTISSAVFTGHTTVTDWQSDWQTDHTTQSV